MKRIFTQFYFLVSTAMAIVVALTTSGMGQVKEVVGTGHADVDVLNVQDAVDHFSSVTLRGHFSFDTLPTVPTGLASVGYPFATIRVSKSVSISGAVGEDGERTTIDGGTIPFYVESPGASVTIQSLRFVRPIAKAIFVYAVSGLTITKCEVDGIVPGGAGGGSIAIDIDTSGNPPTPTQPGRPENISGRLLITGNDIDAEGGSVANNTLGITVFSVGQSPDKEADVYILGNRIRNTTEPAINFRRLGGRADLERNVIDTGPVSSQKAPRPEAIRIANTGSYVLAHNQIDCQWPDPEAIGIGVFSQFAVWPLEHAVIVDNDVTMSPPPGTVFGDLSAGIDIRGFTQDNVVEKNRIRGRARAALAVDPFRGGIPTNNAFVLNDLDDFYASVADVFVGDAVTNTLLLGQEGSLQQDDSVNTVILPLDRKPGRKE